MRILYLHQYFKFPDEMGGTRSYDLSKSFKKEGHKVTIISSTSDKTFKKNKKWSRIVKDGIEVYYIYIEYSCLLYTSPSPRD